MNNRKTTTDFLTSAWEAEDSRTGPSKGGKQISVNFEFQSHQNTIQKVKIKRRRFQENKSEDFLIKAADSLLSLKIKLNLSISFQSLTLLRG